MISKPKCRLVPPSSWYDVYTRLPSALHDRNSRCPDDAVAVVILICFSIVSVALHEFGSDTTQPDVALIAETVCLLPSPSTRLFVPVNQEIPCQTRTVTPILFDFATKLSCKSELRRVFKALRCPLYQDIYHRGVAHGYYNSLNRN